MNHQFWPPSHHHELLSEEHADPQADPQASKRKVSQFAIMHQLDFV